MKRSFKLALALTLILSLLVLAGCGSPKETKAVMAPTFNAEQSKTFPEALVNVGLKKFFNTELAKLTAENTKLSLDLGFTPDKKGETAKVQGKAILTVAGKAYELTLDDTVPITEGKDKAKFYSGPEIGRASCRERV